MYCRNCGEEFEGNFCPNCGHPSASSDPSRANPSAQSPEWFAIDVMEGIEFENYCVSLLSKYGFTDLKTTQASGDQGVDIIGIKNGVKYAIQCKRYSSPLGNSPIQEVNAGKVFYDCQAAAVMTNSTFTSGAKELAEKTGVLLWDRNVLSTLIAFVNTPTTLTSGEKTNGSNGFLAKNTHEKPDPLLSEILDWVSNNEIVSTALLQRNFKIGYAHSARLVDTLYDMGVVSEFTGASPRKIIMSQEQIKDLKHQLFGTSISTDNQIYNMLKENNPYLDTATPDAVVSSTPDEDKIPAEIHQRYCDAISYLMRRGNVSKTLLQIEYNWTPDDSESTMALLSYSGLIESSVGIQKPLQKHDYMFLFRQGYIEDNLPDGYYEGISRVVPASKVHRFFLAALRISFRVWGVFCKIFRLIISIFKKIHGSRYRNAWYTLICLAIIGLLAS